MDTRGSGECNSHCNSCTLAWAACKTELDLRAVYVEHGGYGDRLNQAAPRRLRGPGHHGLELSHEGNAVAEEVNAVPRRLLDTRNQTHASGVDTRWQSSTSLGRPTSPHPDVHRDQPAIEGKGDAVP